MQELNIEQVDAVSGGVGKVIAEAIIGSAAYDMAKSAFTYAMANSWMGQGKFPPVIRPGRE